MARMWMVRAGQNGVHASDFLDGGYASVGFDEELGVLPPAMSREQLIERLTQLHPARKRGAIVNAAGQLHRFHFEVERGDSVITYDPAKRRYLLGTVEGDVEHVLDGPHGHPYRRRVAWQARVSRDALSVTTRNTLGSTLTLFLLNDDAAADLRQRAVALDAPADASVTERLTDDANGEVALTTMLGDAVSRANEFIEDLIAGLDPGQMEELVAGLLRAMGYKTRTSPKGPDRGVDIFASPDGLGLQEPRIFVEVKHRGASMGAPELRAFLGGRRAGDRCLFVSTGGFTKEALYEAERASIPLTLIDLPSLRELLVEHYDALDTATRALVPLTRIYWPAATND